MSAVQPLAQPPANDIGMMAQSNTTMLLMNPVAMEQIYRFAEVIASGKTAVPQHLRGNTADCMAITMQAMQWGLNPFAVMQKTHVINGVLGYEAQLVAAVINSSGVVVDRFHFEWFGPWERIVGKFEVRKGDKGEYRVPGWKLADEEGCGIRIWATLRGESEPRELTLLLAQARTRNSTLWADDPKQQLAYLAQKRWARLYASDVILGVYSADELEPPAQSIKDINPIPDATTTEQKGSAVKGSLKNKPKASEPAVQTEQQKNTSAPNFDDAEAASHTFSPEAQKFADSLIDCYEGEHFSEWKKAVQAKFPANSVDFVELVNAYNNRVAYLKTQNQGA